MTKTQNFIGCQTFYKRLSKLLRKHRGGESAFWGLFFSLLSVYPKGDLFLREVAALWMVGEGGMNELLVIDSRGVNE
jgi:hypothetical protein